MDFTGGLDDNPWAPTATAAEINVLQRKPDSPPLEHISQDLDMFDPWADPTRAQLPDFSLGQRPETKVAIDDKEEEETHDVVARDTEVADFPNGLFYIRSVLSHKVLDVRGGSKKADTQIVLWSQKKDGMQTLNQLWLYHEGFIVNVNSRLVLDIRGSLSPNDLDTARIIQYNRKEKEDAHNQLFAYDEGRIYCQAKPHLVLDVADKSSEEGVEIIINERDDDRVSQIWSFEEVQASFDKEKLLGVGKSHWWK
ncbi:hypothetical protein INT44_001817 [Umbelopsis vinacea]|uniref:Ricin B lectin domain-containing protein n=1 Tax=Umbelopsis vinacea TaxID=44442 RepID=A0A8H7PQM1_9FUNG|nr:hypothetical protein INT44_001817 [Umbelopsis vinacea]